MRSEAEQLGGALMVESVPGEGTTITCVVSPMQRSKVSKVSKRIKEEAEMSTAGRIRAMVVDDHPVMRSGLRDVLEASGRFEVVGQAGDGEEAVTTAPELNPQVIVMDVIMPNKNGIDACREIMELLPDTRVMMLTASTEEDAVIEAIAAGATGYLQKYSPAEELVGAVAGCGRRAAADTRQGGAGGVRPAPQRGAVLPPWLQPADGPGAGHPDPVRQRPVLRGDCPGAGQQHGHRPQHPCTACRTSWASRRSRNWSSGPCATAWWTRWRWALRFRR